MKPLLAEMKRDWLKHNSDYERMEGIVAGTPSLVQYDVDIDAGASFKEDPKGAVSFSLKAPERQDVPAARRALQHHRGRALGRGSRR